MIIEEKIKKYYLELVHGKRKGALDALFSFILLLFSFIYGLFVKLILFCYQAQLFKTYKPRSQVISVGNITWGGTGKTPLVEALTGFLKQQGKHPAILTRGYGQDEIYMLKEKFRDIPVLAGRNRIKAVQEAEGGYGVDTIILDDGFQHWRLRRDVDIVLIDATSPFGNGRLLPCGMLREPLSALARADIFILTRADLGARNIESIERILRRYNQQAPIYQARHLPAFLRQLPTGKRMKPAAIKNRPTALLCAIAQPQAFAQSLERLPVEISLSFNFTDHYQYSRADIRRIEKKCLEKQIYTVVTTEKDAAKLAPLLKSEELKIELLALAIEFMFIKDEDKFFNYFRALKNIQEPYSILILSDGKAGHLNQSQAIARMIQKKKQEQELLEGANSGIQTKIVQVKFRHRLACALLTFCALFSQSQCRKCLACLRFCLDRQTFATLMRSPARIIISAGSSLSGVNLFLGYKYNASKVVLMKPPFFNSNRFDLVVAPKHDRIRPRDNVLLTRIAPNLIDRQYLAEQADVLKNRMPNAECRMPNKGPTIGVFIGGDTPNYQFSSELVNIIIAQLKLCADSLDSPLLVTTSRRTPKIIEQLLKANFADFPRCRLLVIANEKNIPEAVGGILGVSEIILVSGESISMVSEAVSAEKYVLVFKPQKKAAKETKQERFLAGLAKDGILKVISPENVAFEIEKVWQEKPTKKKINDREQIYQALDKIVR